MKRRDFLKAAGATALGMARREAHADPGKTPNLLVIQTDEHNLRTLGCYRRGMSPDQAFVWGRDVAVETPNIDWIAQNGALCKRFYASTPLCSPSRGSFVTGRYPQHTPVVNNNIPMDDGAITFAEILRRRGYATGYGGKWHLDGNAKPGWAPGRKFGFDDNEYMFNRGHWKQLEDTPDGPRVKARDEDGSPNYDVKGADEESFTTDFLADRCVDFVRRNRDRPFCYMLSIPDPHGPNTVRPPYDTMFKNETFRMPHSGTAEVDDLPAWGERNRKGPGRMDWYFGMVKCIDDNVGKILEALRENGLLEKTIVVFTADHGDLCGEHGRHDKGVPFEMSARVPMLVYHPDKIPAGTEVEEVLTCVDFLPTVLAMMSVPTAGAEEGRDASGLLAGNDAPAGWDDVGFIRGSGPPGRRSWLAAVTPRYKLVYDGAGKPWLFDLEEDPDELVNYFEKPDCRGVVRDLTRALQAYCTKYGDPFLEVENIRSAMAAALEA